MNKKYHVTAIANVDARITGNKVRPCQIGFLLSVRVRVGFRVLNPIKNKSRSEPGNAPRIGIGHSEVVCQKYL